jgi:rare lipoprotein A
MAGLPSRGLASTYSDWFVGKTTSNGDTYSHDSYTAALLPKSRWHAVPMGTHLELLAHGRKVVVKINDRGKGNGEERVLDLSRAAYAYLIGMETSAITDQNASIVRLDLITLVAADTTLGPVTS